MPDTSPAAPVGLDMTNRRAEATAWVASLPR